MTNIKIIEEIEKLADEKCFHKKNNDCKLSNSLSLIRNNDNEICVIKMRNDPRKLGLNSEMGRYKKLKNLESSRLIEICNILNHYKILII